MRTHFEGSVRQGQPEPCFGFIDAEAPVLQNGKAQAKVERVAKILGELLEECWWRPLLASNQGEGAEGVANCLEHLHPASLPEEINDNTLAVVPGPPKCPN